MADRIVRTATTSATVVTGRVIGATPRRVDSAITVIGSIVRVDAAIIADIVGGRIVYAMIVVGIMANRIIGSAAATLIHAAVIGAVAAAHFGSGVFTARTRICWCGQGKYGHCGQQREFEGVFHCDSLHFLLRYGPKGAGQKDNAAQRILFPAKSEKLRFNKRSAQSLE